MKKILLILVINLFQFLSAQQSNPISGQTFFDFTYIADHYSSLQKSKNSFETKRILVFYDKKFENSVNFRFGIEGNNSDFTPSGTYSMFLKALFVEKTFENNSSLQMGLFPVSTNAFDEKFWGNRFLDKVVIDRLGLGAPTDFGISYKGNLISDLNFNLAVVNGTGIKAENDKNKKILLALQYKFSDNISMELYNDYENVANDKSRMTNKITIGYSSKIFSTGFSGFQKNFKHLGYGVTDSLANGISLFSWYEIFENVRTISRFDYYNKNSNNSVLPNTETYVLFGLDYLPDPKIHISPNIIFKQNDIGKDSNKKSFKETYFRLNVGIYF